MNTLSRLQIAADLKNLAKIRRFVKETAAAVNVEPTRLADLQLAVVEMVTNTILHGYQGQEGLIEIEIMRKGTSLMIRLRDQAPPFDPTVIPPPDVTSPLERRPIGGMGVYLTKKLVDEITHRVTTQGGNELTLVKNQVILHIPQEGTMNITVEQGQGKIPVTVLGLHGDLDASNYQQVIAKAREVYSAGAKNILIDMSDVPFMASSGLAALHSIAVLVRGEEPPDPEHGWAAFHALDRDRDSGFQEHVKLLNPQAQVERTLELSGLKTFFEIHTDKETAIASF